MYGFCSSAHMWSQKDVHQQNVLVRTLQFIRYLVFVNDELLCSQLKKTLYGIWRAGALVYASRCSRHGVRVTVFASMAVRGGRGSTALPPVCVSDRVLGWCIDPRVY